MTSAMNLGDLIDALKQCRGKTVRIAAPMTLHPKGLDSYRGYYEDLAIGYEYGPDAKAMTVAALTALLEGAVGQTFTGYKGGEYVMGRSTWVWIAEYGRTSEFRVGGVHVPDDDHDVAYLLPCMGWCR